MLLPAVRKDPPHTQRESGTSNPPQDNLDSEEEEEHQEPSQARPRRAAASEARDRVKACSLIENEP